MCIGGGSAGGNSDPQRLSTLVAREDFARLATEVIQVELRRGPTRKSVLKRMDSAVPRQQ